MSHSRGRGKSRFEEEDPIPVIPPRHRKVTRDEIIDYIKKEFNVSAIEQT
jgi:hypothetical protein